MKRGEMNLDEYAVKPERALSDELGASLGTTDAPAGPAPHNDPDMVPLAGNWGPPPTEVEEVAGPADAARAEGREHGIATAVEALAPALDALALGIEAARASPEAEDRRLVAHLEGLHNIRTAFETGLKALGVRTIAPENTPFDPALHEATQMQETTEAGPGQVLVLHQSGFAIGQRLIRPARVTVSVAPNDSLGGVGHS